MPARNESADISVALDAVIAQDLPLDRIEVIVVDGGSIDGTADIVWEKLSSWGFARVVIVSNPIGDTPSNLNAGLEYVTAPVVCRVDARSVVPPTYVRRCIEVLEQHPTVVVVGGSQISQARDGSVVSRGIARAINNRWGMGLARYRRRAESGPADTVYLGAFRTEELRGAGGWDERFSTNQDFELNRRMGKQGVVWFEAALSVGYLPRATISDLFRQYRRFGSWKVHYWRTTGDRPQPRQILLITGPLLALAVLAYLGVRKRSWLVPFAIAALFGLSLVEMKGSADSGEDGLLIHGVAAVALVSVGAGWTVGVWDGTLRRSWGQRD